MVLACALFKSKFSITIVLTLLIYFYIEYNQNALNLLVNTSKKSFLHNNANITLKEMKSTKSQVIKRLKQKAGTRFLASSKLSKKKELQYFQRRQNIFQMCQQIGPSLTNETWNLIHSSLQNLLHLEHQSISYCPIPKVASTFWTKNVMILGGKVPLKKNHVVAKNLFPFPASIIKSSFGINSTFHESLTSMVFVRHPLNRLVSAYYSKIVEHPKWIKVRGYITRMFRRKLTVDHPATQIDHEIPTPEEFLKFVLYDLDTTNPNYHWLPQHLICPFCLLNFTIYGKLEEMDEDFQYLIEQKHLQNYFPKPKHHMYHKPRDKSVIDTFWKSVSKDTKAKIIKRYEMDFKMFGYSSENYF